MLRLGSISPSALHGHADMSRRESVHGVDRRPCRPKKTCRSRHPSNKSTEELWDAYKARHGIRSALTMAHMRHFVKRHGRKVLDPAILAYWSGHDAKSEGGGMSLHYGTNLPVQEVLEEQSREWPDGPIGDLMPVRIHETEAYPPQVMDAIREYMKGGSDSELTMALGEVRKKATPFVRP